MAVSNPEAWPRYLDLTSFIVWMLFGHCPGRPAQFRSSFAARVFRLSCVSESLVPDLIRRLIVRRTGQNFTLESQDAPSHESSKRFWN
jgi:hypothetical protein